MLEIKFEQANRVLGSLKPRSIYTQGCLLPSCPQTPNEVTVQLREKPAQRLPHRLPLAGCSFPTAACWLLHCSPDLTGHPSLPPGLLFALSSHKSHVCMCKCIHICIHIHVSVYMCKYVLYTRAHTYAHACTHACTHLHAVVFPTVCVSCLASPGQFCFHRLPASRTVTDTEEL